MRKKDYIEPGTLVSWMEWPHHEEAELKTGLILGVYDKMWFSVLTETGDIRHIKFDFSIISPVTI